MDPLYLISEGNVGALPAVVSYSLNTVFAEGLVRDRNSLRQPAVFQKHLRRQRLCKIEEPKRYSVPFLGGSSRFEHVFQGVAELKHSCDLCL